MESKQQTKETYLQDSLNEMIIGSRSEYKEMGKIYENINKNPTNQEPRKSRKQYIPYGKE
jgi:hypothetical protein